MNVGGTIHYDGDPDELKGGKQRRPLMLDFSLSA
jgi:hypothetical protein